MNQVTPRLLALVALTGSVAGVFAAAQAPTPIHYNLNAHFTNNPPRLLDIGALPKAAAGAPFKSADDAVLLTDGAGKLHGVQTVVSDLGGGTQVVFSADITGAIVGRGKTNGDAAVHLAIKGSAHPDGSKTRATLNLRFQGATGITPNSQSIRTAAPGFNIRLLPDGTTNRVERYDPWTGAEGLTQGWNTYSFEVHSYRIQSLFTTNGPEAEVPFVVSNSVNAAIQNIDLAGYDHYNERYTLIKFGNPIKRDRGDGYVGTNSYGTISMYAAGDTVTNIPLWIISESVETTPDPENPANYLYTTNLLYGADIADLGNCLAAYHSFYDTRSGSEWSPGQNQFETNYARSLIATTTTNTIQPTLEEVVKGGRHMLNCWNTIQGTLEGSITWGKAKVALKQSAATLEEEHELWTPLVSAAGEESYLVQPVSGSLTVLTNDVLGAAVQQSGRKLKFTGDPANWGFKGQGTVHPGHGRTPSTYSANLRGVGSAKGAALQLKGATRTVIADYEVITDAPPAVRSLVNLAADGAFPLAVTNTTSGRLQVPAQTLTVTNLQNNVVSVITYSYPAFNVDNPCFKTNTVVNAIDTVIANGKVMGQKWVANTVGLNLDAPYPDPLPVVPAP